MLSYKNVMCVCAWGRGGGGLWMWMDMRGWPGVDIHVCAFAQGLTLSYHNVVWQGDQCLIFHIVLLY